MASFTPTSSAMGAISPTKSEEMLAQAFDADIAVFVELAEEARAVIDGFAGRHPVDQVALKFGGLALRP